MSLRNQINIRVLSIVLIVLIAGGAIAIWKAKSSVEDEVSSSFQLVKSMLDFQLKRENILTSAESEASWLTHLASLKETRHVKIVIYDNNAPDMTATASHIEEEESTPPHWFVYAVSRDFPVLEHRIHFPENSKKSILIATDPSDEINEAWSEFLTLFWSIIAILTVLFMTINTLFNAMLNAVIDILNRLKAISSGEYGSPLAKHNIQEFDLISQEINELTRALEQSKQTNKKLTNHSLNIQENERKSMAHELHDEMGQSLTAIKAISVATKQRQSGATVACETIISICDHLSNIVRSRMLTLHPLCLAELGLKDTLKNLVQEWEQTHLCTQVELKFDGEPDHIDHQAAIHIYRITQECLTNIAKHANASHVSIHLTLTDTNEVSLLIKDNGSGILQDDKSKGFGLLGIKERAESQGGKLNIISNLGAGMLIDVFLPLSGVKS